MHDIYKYALDILKIDSPSGFTKNMQDYLINFAKNNKIEYEISRKGNINFHFEGKNKNYTTNFATHIDTLGLMIKNINNKGELLLTTIGGPLVNTLNGEYVNIYTRNNKIYEGTIIGYNSSIHVTKEASNLQNIENLIVRIDEQINNKQDVEKLGISAGDFIAYDPKTKIVNEFIKSRFLDDKICVATILNLISKIKTNKFENNVIFSFSTYEEVGHGMSYVPDNVDELIAIDMACVGQDLNGSEYKVTICAKDSGGPYDYDLTNKLINCAKDNKIDYVIDIYPFYGSDATAAIHGGANTKVALVGPGVASSHGMERTHLKSLINLENLIKSYLKI